MRAHEAWIRVAWIAAGVALAVVLAVALASPSLAREPTYKLEGASHKETLRPTKGFVDSPLALDPDSSRLVYIVSNAADSATMHVRDLGSSKEVESFSIDGLKGTPIAIDLLPDETIVVVTTAGGNEFAQTIVGGKVRRRFGPATRVRVAKIDDKPVIAVYRKKSKGRYVVHTSEARDPTTGKRVGKRTRLKVDAKGRDAKKGFVLHYWHDEHLTAVGLREGRYDRKADQQMPDEAARLNMTSGSMAATAISDVMSFHKQLPLLVAHSNEAIFVALDANLKSVNLVEKGTSRQIKLAEPANHYDPSSLTYRVAANGSLFFTMRIDPVHPDAAAKKRAVPSWVDLYEVRAGQSSASRRARLLADDLGRFHWIANASTWVLLRDHVGFSRGGPELEVFELATTRAVSAQ